MPGDFPLAERELDNIVDLALAEDTGHGDITSEALIPADLNARSVILAKAVGVLAGGKVARRVFRRVDPSLRVDIKLADGTALKPGDVIGTVSGGARSILKAERVALNFLQRLSGIATLTARYVREISGSRAVITDTRKTTPGLRMLEKYAVRMGGGHNHRLHLGDGILIKDNHLAALRARGMSMPEIIARARSGAPPGMAVEVEVTTRQEAGEARDAGADIIMLDNMSPEEMAAVVKMLGGRVRLEASGGVTLENVRQVALSGVDIISVGALTHSPKALDISMEFTADKP